MEKLKIERQSPRYWLVFAEFLTLSMCSCIHMYSTDAVNIVDNRLNKCYSIPLSVS